MPDSFVTLKSPKGASVIVIRWVEHNKVFGTNSGSLTITDTGCPAVPIEGMEALRKTQSDLILMSGTGVFPCTYRVA